MVIPGRRIFTTAVSRSWATTPIVDFICAEHSSPRGRASTDRTNRARLPSLCVPIGGRNVGGQALIAAVTFGSITGSRLPLARPDERTVTLVEVFTDDDATVTRWGAARRRCEELAIVLSCCSSNEEG